MEGRGGVKGGKGRSEREGRGGVEEGLRGVKGRSEGTGRGGVKEREGEE